MPRARTTTAGRAVSVPAARQRAAKQIGAILTPGMRVALTTHVNADGDGAGSEVALWHLLTARGIRPVIVNPTPFPERYTFLLDGADHADKSRHAVKHLRHAEAVVVLDISDLGRLGQLGHALAAIDVPVACIDHHVSKASLPSGPRLVDDAACATGELVYDLARTLRWQLSPAVAEALYVALMMDTGGFRFANTTPRALQVAAHLLGHGLDAEAIYRHLYANASEGRLRLLAEVLETLVVEADRGLAWVTVPDGAFQRYGVDAEDLEGVVEFPRSIQGIRLAILFRPLSGSRIKASFRSVGDIDAAALAQTFGGGGHRKAAGAAVDGPLATVQAEVLAAARRVLETVA